MLAFSLALLADFAGLILSTWLGIYIVTHCRRSWIAWTSSLTLWASAGLFANTLMFMFSNPLPVAQPDWLRLIFPSWPQESDNNIAGWTQGWISSLGVFLWYQTTVLIIPGKLATWRRWSLYVGYATGIVAVILLIYMPDLFKAEASGPLLVKTQNFNSIYPFFVIILVIYSGLSVYNLIEAKKLSATRIEKRQIDPLIAASVLASLTTILSVLGGIPGLSVPIFWVSTILVFAVGFFGFGVTRYSALMENRILRRDLIYSAVATSLALFVYLSIFLWLRVRFQLPQGIVVFLIPLVIISHSITEEVRQILERFLYDRKARSLRARLRDLGRLAGEHGDLNDMLSRSLEAICAPVRATYGVILLFDQDHAQPTGMYRWHGSKHPLLRHDFEADDVKHLAPGSLPEPFFETTLLIPLYISMEQIGVLLLGRPENGIHYPTEDVLLLQDPIERITDLIIRTRRIDDYLDQILRLPLQANPPPSTLIPVAWVEDALQNLYNYAYLGDGPLTNLNQVKVFLNSGPSTHLDKGKAVNQVISTAIEKLRPQSALPTRTIPREWYPYIILHDAYFEGLPNRDIINKLYISEGTFHRTRRSAIRSVARVLSELEITQKYAN